MSLGRSTLDSQRLLNSQPHPRPTSLLVQSSVPPLTIYTLGRFAVYRGQELIDDVAWNRRKAKSLFKLLLLAPQHQLLKDQVLEWLWPDQDTKRAANNLHRTLFVLRRVLQPDLTNASDSGYVCFKGDKLALSAVSAWIDVAEFERLIQLGRQQPDPLPSFEAACALYQGDFLPEDLYEEWASSPRQTYHVAYCSLVGQMARLYTQNAAYQEAVACLLDLLRLDPAHEESCRHLMQLYTQIGERHQAIQLYQQLQQTLHRELEVEPSAETTALYQSIVENRWQPPPKPAGVSALIKIPVRRLDLRERPALIGREAELQELETLLQQVKTGCGRVVILSGEQGAGKTRLAEEITYRAGSGGMQILHGAAYEQEGHLPYGPFVEAIRSSLTGEMRAGLREKLGSLSQDLARLLPELAEAGLPALSSLDLELGQERQRLFDAVAATLLAFAQASGLVLFLDDLHAAGESSLQLLHYLARRIADQPILILCTVRAEQAQRGTPIGRLCQELFNQHLGMRLHIAPLLPGEVAQLCSRVLNGGFMAAGLAEAIHDLAEGNPLFVQEIVLALQQTGKIEQVKGSWHITSSPVPTGSGQLIMTSSDAEQRFDLWDHGLMIPARVHEVLALRLERLSPAAYRLAGLAAVIGREFSYRLLQAASQLPSATLLDLLEEMQHVYLIEEMGAGYRFRHGLIRQVLYNDLTLHRRVWLHGQVAQVLEELVADQLNEQAAIFVYHYERAERFEQAFQYLIRAGDRAQTTYAPREAMDYFNRAVTLCQQHRELATAETMSALLQRRAQTHLTLSDFEAAILDLEQLLENHRQTNDRLREGEALYQIGIAHYWAHRLERAAAYLDQAIQLAESLRYDKLQTKALKLRDILNSTRGEGEQVAVLKQPQATDSTQVLPAEEHWGLALLAHLHSDFDTALHHGQACVELGQSLSNPFLALGGYFVVGMSYTSLGHYQTALNDLRHALDLSQAAEERFWRARLLNTVGWVYRELFDLEQAIQFDKASLELARAGELCLTEAEGNALANLATNYLLLKDYDQARAYLAEGLDSSGDKPFMRWRYRTRMLVLKGRLALAEGDVPGALAAADESLAMTRQTHARKNVARSCRLRGEALLAAGQIHKARAALRHALDIGLSIKSPDLTWTCYLLLAQLEEAANRPDVAKTHYFCAAQTLNELASHLTDSTLRHSFLTAQPVQLIFEKAICQVPFDTLER